MGSGSAQRPLSEVSPVAQRRNSPVWNQNTKTMRNSDASNFEVSSSPRLFWQGRESGSPFPRSSENQAPYDPDSPYSASKRPSLENLKRASRVKNSNMLRERNQEYDPASVYVPQRPLATSRSPQKQSQSNSAPQQPQNRDDRQPGPRPPSPSKDQASPAKSSLSRASRFGVKGAGFDPESEIWSDFDSVGNRYPKSVTFDAAPPQVNEYEMTTPDPSSIASESRDGSYDSEEDEVDVSFDRESSLDRDDSFDASLEDLEKTPVVLPEDWRYMSPSTANDELVKEDDDPFTEDDESHSPGPTTPSQQKLPLQHSRVESLDSNGERRPLPPLPGAGRQPVTPRSSSPGKLAAAFELGSGGKRVLPSPPAPASCTKSDISELSRASMSLEDRLRLMMLRKDERAKQEQEHATDVQDKPSEGPDHATEDQDNHEAKDVEEHDTDELDIPMPRISRDSILKDLRRSDSFLDDPYDEDESQIASSPHHYMNYDPDVPIPSLENDNDVDDDYEDSDSDVVIKREEHDDDLYDIPKYDEILPSLDPSLKDLEDKHATDGAQSSQLSRENSKLQKRESQGSNDSQATPVPLERSEEAVDGPDNSGDQELPSPKMAAITESLRRPMTPEINESGSDPCTPDSVIRHPIDEEDDDSQISSDESVPEPIATIKAPNGLKTRPSLTPADVDSMAAVRRKVSGQQPPSMLTLSKQISHESDLSSPDDSASESGDKSAHLTASTAPNKDLTQRQTSFVKLDIPFSIQEESLGMGLDKEFDRVIESQKVAFEKSLAQLFASAPTTSTPDSHNPQDPRNPCIALRAPADRQFPKQRGYLMRHNTKVVIASNRSDEESAPTPGETSTDPRMVRSPAPSPRKASQQTWTTVPWNGQPRRPSMRMSGGIPKKKPVAGPVPPLPGQSSNVQESIAPIEENEPTLDGALDDGEERGRLFVKVVGMKYLDLPLPKGERSYFALTLDNGLHCVTTAWLELGKTAPIGQEFELIVQNDLEFQLTLQMKVDDAKFRVQEPAAPASPARQKASTFSRVFASPRKRKEMEMKHQLASQQQKSKDVNAGVWDRLRTLIARDGSFGRAYVALSDHEKYAFGRPYTVDVACFNEWAVDEQPSSVKSKKSTSSAASQRRPPYKIGKLELQLLFVPKPKGGKDEDMPKSMNACIREMREAEAASARTWEGFLSQQGGDCPYWRRRFFKLQGSKLTAYHETTRQPRATINLSKAAKLIDDRSSLIQKETTTKGGGRRKSAFAEEEEGYMFVEEGFRIRFGNGEVIDFYADSAADKEGWMKVLAETVGKGSSSGSSQIKPWTELVLKRERSMKSRRETTDRFSTHGPPPPKKDVVSAAGMTTGPAPAPASPRPGHKHTQSQPDIRSADVRRQKARSLMF
ncbi:bud site selection protein BUD4 [Aspergillus udagawae]|nr:bud site selection protein BUD4 [Aspergillus udagawae]GFG19790.1 bud site selection protein BUD4 [Aspergillus udagawae]